MNQRRILSFFIVLVNLSLTLFFLSSCVNRQPIRLGYVSIISGLYSEVGIAARDSAQLALDEINAEGGIDDVPLQLITRDDNQIVEGYTQNIIQELLQEGVIAIIQQNSSSETAEILPFMNQNKVVLIGTAATSSDFSGKKDYFFRVVPDNQVLGIAFADYLHKTYAFPGYSVLINTLNPAFSDPFLKAVEKRLQEFGEKIDTTISFDSNTDNLRLIGQQAAAGDPKGVIIMAGSVETAKLAQYMRQQGSQAQFFSTIWAHTATLIEKGGRAVQGMVLITNVTTMHDNPTYQNFAGAFYKRYHRQPGLDTLHAYEAVKILALALKQTHGKAEGLPEALTAIHDFPGVLGNISFDAYGDVKRDVYIIKVDGDHFTTVQVIPPKD